MIFILESGRPDRFAKSTQQLRLRPRNYGFDVVTKKQAVYECVHELDHVIAFREWLYCRTSSGVRRCRELEEPNGP